MTTIRKKVIPLLPFTPAQWYEANEEDPFGTEYQTPSRVSVCALGNLTPSAIVQRALKVLVVDKDYRFFLTDGFSSIALLTALKENIRWFHRRIISLYEKEIRFLELLSNPDTEYLLEVKANGLFNNQYFYSKESHKTECDYLAQLSPDVIANMVFLQGDQKDPVVLGQDTVTTEPMTVTSEVIVRYAADLLTQLEILMLRLEGKISSAKVDEGSMDFIETNSLKILVEPYLRRGSYIRLIGQGKDLGYRTARFKGFNDPLISLIGRFSLERTETKTTTKETFENRRVFHSQEG